MPDALAPGPPPALKARFLERLGERLRRFAALRDDARPEARDELRQLAHALAGSSATYGYATLGERARAVERLVVELSDPRRLAEAVQDLLAEGERARGAAPRP